MLKLKCVVIDCIIFITTFFIKCIEKYEYRKLELDESDIDKKIIDDIDIRKFGIEILTDTGYKPVSNLYRTQPYRVWTLKTESGKYLKCADLHIVFDKDYKEVFVKDLKVGDYIITEDGPECISSIKKGVFSLGMYDITVDDDNHRFYSNGILSHNTICSSIFISHYLLFNYDKTSLFLSNKADTTREIIDKVKVILENLPFFLKPGLVKNDVFNMKFDNGCRIVGQSTTKKAGIGYTIHMLFLDEFAHINEKIIDTFYENVFPVLSSSKIARIIITSTPNGYNKFFEIYDAAVKEQSQFRAFTVNWWQIPGRDETWMKNEIANLGSEEAFMRQYGNQFCDSSDMLIGATDVKRMQDRMTRYISHEFDELNDIDIPYKKELLWKPDFDIDKLCNESEFFVISADIAEGGGSDYSIINIFHIDLMDKNEWKDLGKPQTFHEFFYLNQVGLFRSNKHSVEEFSKILYILVYKIMYSENVKIVVEWNAFGGELMRYLQTIFPKINEFDEENFVKFKHRNDSNVRKFGIKIKPDNKPVICQKFKKFVKDNKIKLHEFETVQETLSFGKDKNGRYKGLKRHDDIVMTAVNISEFLETADYADFIEELYDNIDVELKNKIDVLLDRDNDGDASLNYDIYDVLGGDYKQGEDEDDDNDFLF